MSRTKHILRIAAKAVAACGVLAALGFVERSGGSVPVREIRVELDMASGMHFIDEEAVRQEVLNGAGPVIGTPIHKVDETGIEQRLRAIPSVAEADVYHTMDGILHVKARQREPLVRVVNADGTGFYIDKEGWTMPLSDHYTARVMVVTGQLHEPFATCAPVNVAQGNDSLALHTHSRAIHGLARNITADPLWKAMFGQAVMDQQGEFTLIPSVGMMQVRIGAGDDLPQRLAKLRMFLDEGISQTDWRRYRTIDLRFDDQVVCTKRTHY